MSWQINKQIDQWTDQCAHQQAQPGTSNVIRVKGQAVARQINKQIGQWTDQWAQQ
jgi:hypothetical protein